MSKPKRYYPKRDQIARKVADMHGVSYDYVRRLRNGEREIKSPLSEAIMASLVDYRQAEERLIDHLVKLVPIKSNNKKYENTK